MNDQAHTLSETIINVSENTLMTNMLVEELIEERLLNNATVIKWFYENDQVTNPFLKEFADQNNLFRINIFSSTGKKLYSSHIQVHDDLYRDKDNIQILNPIFSGDSDTLLIGLKAARSGGGFRYAVAVAAQNRSAIVVNLDAAQLLDFRKMIGFGSLLQTIIQNPGIDYAALQDTSGILAASGNIEELERINTSEFLRTALIDSVMNVRIVDFKARQVYEAVHPFIYNGEAIGLFRLGLSLDPLESLNRQIYQRITIISLILLIVGFVLFTLIMFRQNLEISKKQYQAVETYSRNILQNISDGIIVCNREGELIIFNRAAEQIFERKASQTVGSRLNTVLSYFNWKDFLTGKISMQESVLQFKAGHKNILISRSEYLDPDEESIIILVIRDITDRKRLENQVQRREQLSALGQLASGVAHEIRNPLNAIGTIIQQIERDFKPATGIEDFEQLTRIVYQEVKRINQTIENFLKFARPDQLKLSSFLLSELLKDLKHEYEPFLKEKEISLSLKMNWSGEVQWDENKIRQVLNNLIRNASEALDKGGKIEIEIQKIDQNLIELKVSDNGRGIPEPIQRKVFNLYFTTKSNGTGIGLSIVQQIVDQHEGVISYESATLKGTIFSILLPIIIEPDKSKFGKTLKHKNL
jgi:PAS domain S-box-containing protein